jgi:hypothetical protein
MAGSSKSCPPSLLVYGIIFGVIEHNNERTPSNLQQGKN